MRQSFNMSRACAREAQRALQQALECCAFNPCPCGCLLPSLQVSRISRESINALKEFFADEMGKDDWRLVIKLKKVFQVT